LLGLYGMWVLVKSPDHEIVMVALKLVFFLYLVRDRVTQRSVSAVRGGYRWRYRRARHEPRSNSTESLILFTNLIKQADQSGRRCCSVNLPKGGAGPSFVIRGVSADFNDSRAFREPLGP